MTPPCAKGTGVPCCRTPPFANGISPLNIPANDDAIRAVKLMVGAIADAAEEGEIWMWLAHVKIAASHTVRVKGNETSS